MPVYKNEKTNKWYVKVFYKNWKNEYKWTTKRGFNTKKEAIAWEREFQMTKAGDMSMRFGEFAKLYEEDIRPRIKESTYQTKSHIIETKVIPYFGDMRMCDITARDVMHWQNEMIGHRDPKTGKKYTQSYLKTLHNQLNAILNHAVRYYGLHKNEAHAAGVMGSSKTTTMDIWSKEEYLLFSEAMMENEEGYYCFEMLYWCGIREGEALALTKKDFDFKKREVSITKTYHRLSGRDLITDPKTPKSVRNVVMPDFLCEEMQDYFRMHPEMEDDVRIFSLTKEKLYKLMNYGCEKQGVKRIRVHDLRHSHVSMLINMGFTAVDIADRVGHESIDITYRYAHLFPNAQKKMATSLNVEREGGFRSVS